MQTTLPENLLSEDCASKREALQRCTRVGIISISGNQVCGREIVKKKTDFHLPSRRVLTFHSFETVLASGGDGSEAVDQTETPVGNRAAVEPVEPVDLYWVQWAPATWEIEMCGFPGVSPGVCRMQVAAMKVKSIFPPEFSRCLLMLVVFS